MNSDIFNPESSLSIKTSAKISSDTIQLVIRSGEKTDLLREKGDFVVRMDGAGTRVEFYTGEKINPDSYRSIGGLIARWLRKSEAENAHLDLPQSLSKSEIAAVLEGLLLAAFTFDKYKLEKKTKKTTLTIDPAHKTILKRITSVCQAVNMARDWSHEPASVINPETLADRCLKLANKFGLKCTVLDDAALKEMGAGAIVAVGQGSKTPSRMILIEYAGDGSGSPVVLVGKAITFDSGGYSIKPVDSMVGMKYDKCGAMAVLGVLRAAAELKLAQPITGVICAAENMLSQNSYRPDDILVSLSGKSIEVISTDAEGRLVLADGLTYAQKHLNPCVMVDLATLTGGCVVSLGHVRAGVLTNTMPLFDALHASGEAVWERVWPLPNDDDYAKLIKGKDADIKNSGGRAASPVTGGMFLKEFVSDDVPWAHMDIAGVAGMDDGNDYLVHGATGFGVRLLIHWLESGKSAMGLK